MKRNHTWRRGLRLASVTLAAVLPSCSSAAARDEAPRPPVIAIGATDYAFQVPDTMRAGLATFTLRNAGAEVHHLQIIRLDSGKTMDDFRAIMRAEAMPPAWVRLSGGPGAVLPGDSASVTLELVPATYVFLCFIPAADHVPHVAKGMMRVVTVVPPSGDAPAAAAPRADVGMVLADYRFELSGALRAGQQVIEVTNVSRQPHEVAIVRLAPGRTTQEFVAWTNDMKQPAPGRPVGGTTGLLPGERNWLSLDLEPGNYVLLCFVPDPSDGRSHIEHGMVREFTIPSLARAE